MPDPMHFDRHADLYDRARPPYPAALGTRLAELGLLVAGHRALDLGAGSGQATRILVDAGMEVTAVEPGGALVDRLRLLLPEVHILQATAEAVRAGAGVVRPRDGCHSGPLVRSGCGAPEAAHRTRRPAGRLAVWRNAYGDPSVPPTAFRTRIAEIVARRDAPPRPGPDETDTARWAALLQAGGYFATVHAEEFHWSVELDEDGVRGLFTTFSDWSPAEAEQAALAVRELGGTVTEHYLTPLIVLARSE